MSTTLSIPVTGLPSYRTVRIGAEAGEEQRNAVFNEKGEWVGAIVYMRRPLGQPGAGSGYGWRPEATKNRGQLLTKTEAVEKLIGPTGP